MTTNARTVAIGTIDSGATTIYADLSGNTTAAGNQIWDAVEITLSTTYVMTGAPEFPSRPPFTGAVRANIQQYPRTSGTTFMTWACEAAALVAAGAASYGA
jgi:hypothetical protein